MRVLVGTSGWGFQFWIGPISGFYKSECLWFRYFKAQGVKT